MASSVSSYRVPSSRPACDNCKNRKTKCDRGSPCSSCVATRLECRLGSRALEKRQRVLISTKYDEAMENVDRQLQEVLQGVHRLLESNDGFRPSNASVYSARSHGSPQHVASSHVLETSEASEGYSGDSSFTAHVKRVADTLRNAAENIELGAAESPPSAPLAATQQLLRDLGSTEINTPASFDVSPKGQQSPYHDPDIRSLPPVDPVLKLLRLAQAGKQRYFIDMPIMDEQEFTELCQKVFFAINRYSVWTWATVNTGLLYLFRGLKECDYLQVGVNEADIDRYERILSSNIDAAIEDLRLCAEPSVEACQALAALCTYCTRSGRNPMAWRLTAASSRMCIDLGLHRIPQGKWGPEAVREKRIFWHTYVNDKALSFTFGRTPSIHQYDVSTERPRSEHLQDAIGQLYYGVFEFAVVLGDVQMDLFSAAAQRITQETRAERAKLLATRLITINNDLKQSLQKHPPTDDLFADVSILLDIMMHCLITIVYRMIPCEGENSHPLLCNFECVRAARKALTAIVQGNERRQSDQTGWSRFLNTLFSFVPFTPFIVLAGYTVAVSSVDDLALLSSTLQSMEAMAAASPTGKKIYDTCSNFHRFADAIVSRGSGNGASGTQPLGPVNTITDFDGHGQFPLPSSDMAGVEFGHTMDPRAWSAVMNDFDFHVADFDANAGASFMEPYLPD